MTHTASCEEICYLQLSEICNELVANLLSGVNVGQYYNSKAIPATSAHLKQDVCCPHECYVGLYIHTQSEGCGNV